MLEKEKRDSFHRWKVKWNKKDDDDNDYDEKRDNRKYTSFDPLNVKNERAWGDGEKSMCNEMKKKVLHLCHDVA